MLPMRLFRNVPDPWLRKGKGSSGTGLEVNDTVRDYEDRAFSLLTLQGNWQVSAIRHPFGIKGAFHLE